MTMSPVIEVRSITPKREVRQEFHRRYIEQGLPLLRRWNFDVVAYGASLHDESSYFVIRRFDSLAEREQMEDAYYASEDWRNGPREALLALMDSYTDVVFEADDSLAQWLGGKRGSEDKPRS
jgi:hypothetical protein